MAQRIVNRLEAVKVNEQNSVKEPASASPREMTCRQFGKHAPVGQAGQVVV